MGHPISDYFRRLVEETAASWNRFWFTPTDAYGVSVLRVLTGAAALLYVLGWTPGLTRWFGVNGILPVQTVTNVLTVGADNGAGFQWSYLSLIQTNGGLWAAHVVAILIVALYLLGVYSRLTSVLTFVVVLGYTHRAPMLADMFGPILCMMLFYMCLAPSGAYLSFDSRRRRRVKPDLLQAPNNTDGLIKSATANLATRLMQVHLVGFYLAMGLSQLGGLDWWNGGAMWMYIADSDSRLIDLTSIARLRSGIFFVNAWTHGIILFELTYAVLIWKRLTRPLLIGVSIFMWSAFALVSGRIPFSLLMILGNAAFIAPAAYRAFAQKFASKKTAETLTSKNAGQPVAV